MAMRECACGFWDSVRLKLAEPLKGIAMYSLGPLPGSYAGGWSTGQIARNDASRMEGKGSIPAGQLMATFRHPDPPGNAGIGILARVPGLTYGSLRAVDGHHPAETEGELTFGRFRLVPGARTLLLSGHPVKLGSRAFDLLHILLLHRGRVVPKDVLVRHVWPDTIVAETNLRFQMAVLRKALERDGERIKTLAGRGYLFALDIDAA